MTSRLQVVAAVLTSAQHPGRVLVAQRPVGKWQAGRWEFPGGKCEPAESEREALDRELMEELGITVLRAESLGHFPHDYVDRQVVIALWWVVEFSGVVQGRDGQALQWLPLQDLPHIDLLEADRPMLPVLSRALADALK